MPKPLSRIYRTDEELGKRDDNYRRSGTFVRPGPMVMLPSPPLWRHKRVLVILVLVGLAYLFWSNIPTDLGSIDQRMGRPLRPGHSVQSPNSRNDGTDSTPPEPRRVPSARRPKLADTVPDEPPPRPKKMPSPDPMIDSAGDGHHYYSGAVRYYKLAATLSRLGKQSLSGGGMLNKNVLFAASSLGSAANLIPLACNMAANDRSHVHFLIVGRAGLPMDALLETNGVDTEDCNVRFHDGRPDYTQWSTDLRARAAVEGALKHVNIYLKPQVIITDDLRVEDAFFAQGINAAATRTHTPVIEIPYGQYTDLAWLARIDAAGLRVLQQTRIDILVHVHAGTTGGIIKLLTSLAEADYAGLPKPRLILDLPPNVDPFVDAFLKQYRWPPAGTGGDSETNNDGVRSIHRITTRAMSPEESSVRFFESFWPSHKANSHVLLLSPRIELSPMYYHYLYYTLLKTRYASDGFVDTDSLLGIGLARPLTLLDGETPIQVPDAKASAEKSLQSVFNWQAPNADATLIFGDKWVEAHSYLSHRLRAFRSKKNNVQRRPKQVSESQPSWMEYLLELMQARGWATMFPQAPASWATVHKELFRIPEEFRRLPPKQESEVDESVGSLKDPFLYGPDIKDVQHPLPKRPKDEAARPIGPSTPLSELLPPMEADPLDEVTALPFLDTEGKESSFGEARKRAVKFAAELRQKVGGCKSATPAPDTNIQDGSVDDLFCFDQDGADEEEVETAGGGAAAGLDKKAVDDTDDPAAAAADVEAPLAN